MRCFRMILPVLCVVCAAAFAQDDVPPAPLAPSQSAETPQMKRLLLGAKFAVAPLNIRQLKTYEETETNVYQHIRSGHGTAVIAGMAASYLITEQLRLCAEINYTFNDLTLERKLDGVGLQDINSRENGMSVPLIIMYNVFTPRPVALYVEAGTQIDVTFSFNDAVNRRTTEQSGVLGAGVTLNVGNLTSHIGYRYIRLMGGQYDVDLRYGELFRHSIGLSLMYLLI